MSKRVKVSTVKEPFPYGDTTETHNFHVYYESGALLPFSCNVPPALQKLFGFEGRLYAETEGKLAYQIHKLRQRAEDEQTVYVKQIAFRVVQDVHFQKTDHNVGFTFRVVWRRDRGEASGHYTLAEHRFGHEGDFDDPVADPQDPNQLGRDELAARLDYYSVQDMTVVDWTPEREAAGREVLRLFKILQESLAEHFGDPAKAVALLDAGAHRLLAPSP